MLSRIDRAKQFLPFAALSPLAIAIEEKEREYIPKLELSEDMKLEISNVLQMMTVGTKINLMYYFGGKYVKVYGEVEKIDSIRKYLIVNNKKIFFTDILKINIIYI